ncbi:MAG: zinc-binding dehydrogenase [Dongiaceae bacterium]
MIESGALRVSINQRFPLRQAADAHRELEARRTTGSTILLP